MPTYTINLYPFSHVPGVQKNSALNVGANKGGNTIFTDNGKTITITDDDSFLQDFAASGHNNPETGDYSKLAEAVTFSPTHFGSGNSYIVNTRVNAVAQIEVANNTTGETGFAQLVTFGSTLSGTTFVAYPFEVSEGDSLTWTPTNNDSGVPVGERYADTQGYDYSEFDGAPPSTSEYTIGLYPLEQIPGVSAGAVLAGEAFNTGGTITFSNVGASVTITDDDAYAEDIAGQNKPETGDNAVLTNDFSLGGTTYPAGTQINAIAQVEVVNDTTGETGFAQIFALGGTTTGPSFVAYPFPVAEGDSLTFTATTNQPAVPNRFGDTQGYEYSEFDDTEPQNYTFDTYQQLELGLGGNALFKPDGFVFVHDGSSEVSTFVVQDEDPMLEDQEGGVGPGGQVGPDRDELLQSINGDTTHAGADISSFTSYTVTGSDGSSFKAYIIGSQEPDSTQPMAIGGGDWSNNLYVGFSEPLVDGVTYTFSEMSAVGQVNYADIADQESTPEPDVSGTPPVSDGTPSVSLSEAIFLGNFTDADTNEGFPPSVSTAPYLGTFGSASNPLWQNEVLVTYDDADGDGTIVTDNYSATIAFADEEISYDLGSGTQTALVDSIMGVSLTVTYTDGSTQATNALMYQDDAGNMFLVNSTMGASVDLNSGSWPQIQSIDVTSVTNTNFGAFVQSSFQAFVCFTSGTLIMTDQGERPVDDLVEGDLVLTMDRGYQPIRWIGSSKVPATGDLAPILIRKGALGNDRDLRVSPQHRMLLQGWQAEMLFGEEQVLATAKSLVNDHSILRDEGGEVEYFHMLFDTHEIIYAEGAPSESFHPGEQGWKALDQATRDEILTLFPELADGRFEDYGVSVRASLKHSEGQLLSKALTSTRN